MIAQERFKELLKDDIYRRWLAKSPSRAPYPCASGKPWRVWAQRVQDGPWGKKDFENYEDAYKFLAKNFRDWWDCALGCRNTEYSPPRVRKGKVIRLHEPTTERGHHWCGFCRRPTVFGLFRRHHAFSHMAPGVNGTEFLALYERCIICGNRLESLTDYERKK